MYADFFRKKKIRLVGSPPAGHKVFSGVEESKVLKIPLLSLLALSLGTSFLTLVTSHPRGLSWRVELLSPQNIWTQEGCEEGELGARPRAWELEIGLPQVLGGRREPMKMASFWPFFGLFLLELAGLQAAFFWPRERPFSLAHPLLQRPFFGLFLPLRKCRRYCGNSVILAKSEAPEKAKKRPKKGPKKTWQPHQTGQKKAPEKVLRPKKGPLLPALSDPEKALRKARTRPLVSRARTEERQM